MKVKTVVASMFVLGVVGGTVLAAQQRGDLAGLRDRLNQGPTQMYTKGGDNWFTQHVTVNGQLNVDGGISDKTRMDPVSRRLGVNGNFLTTTLLPNNNGAGNKSSSDIYLQNSNVSIDIQPSDWVNGHMELTGQDVNNGAIAGTTGQTVVSYVALDEAYATIGNLGVTPWYVSAGREYVPFGYYNDPHPLTYSLTSELSEINDTMVGVGYAQPCGFSAVGYIFRNSVARAQSTSTTNITNTHSDVNNGGVDVGYDWADGTGNRGFKLGGSWIANIVDARSIQPALVTSTGTGTYVNNVGGGALHASGFWNQFDGSVTYVAALKRFDPTDIAWRSATVGARPAALAVEAGYGFMAIGREHRFALGYQQSYQSAALGLPHRRYEADWTVGVFKNTNLQFQYTHDRDYSIADGGTGQKANTGKVRLAVGFL